MLLIDASPAGGYSSHHDGGRYRRFHHAKFCQSVEAETKRWVTALMRKLRALVVEADRTTSDWSWRACRSTVWHWLVRGNSAAKVALA